MLLRLHKKCSFVDSNYKKKVNLKKLIILVIFVVNFVSFGQHKIDAKIELNEDGRTFTVHQNLHFENQSDESLSFIWLYDWINAFSDKLSPLGKRYAQEYTRKFHFAPDKDKGYTEIDSFTFQGKNLQWRRPDGQPDLIEVKLPYMLHPGEKVEIKFSYEQRIPEDRFTGFGEKNGSLSLKNWLVQPAVHFDEWLIYSEIDLLDMPQQAIDYTIQLKLPKGFTPSSAFSETKLIDETENHTRYKLIGNEFTQTDLFIQKQPNFETYVTDYVTVVSNVEDNNLSELVKALIIDRAAGFMNNRLGKYPHDKILVSEEDYNSLPIYGLNQLPSFIRPFPDGFQYDIKFFKAFTAAYLKNSIYLHNRKDQWILDAIQISLLKEYIDLYYPDMKLLGSLSNFYGIKWMNAAKLDFNKQYDFLLQTMIRQNLDQSLTKEQDSLLRFNKKIANPYKAGIALAYLKDYAGGNEIDQCKKLFFERNKKKRIRIDDFREAIQAYTTKDIDWFFDDFATNNQFIDFKIKRIKKRGDSLEVHIKNRYPNTLPIPLYQLEKDKILSKEWIDGFGLDTVVTIKNYGATRLALDHEQQIPELNDRNNYKRVTSLFSKPPQIRIFEDIEDPSREQLFMIPEFGYNFYEGLFLGPKLYNTSFLPKQFSYNLSPKIGTKNGAIVGSAGLDYTFMFKDSDIFAIRMGGNGNRFSYDQDLFFNRYSLFGTLFYRPKDLRSNVRQFFTLRNVSVSRDEGENMILNEPNYNVINANYQYQNKNLDHFFTYELDYQVARDFSKISGETRYRKLFVNNRQINWRLFGGFFVFNDERDSDFFSFALDRPTDYMFDYNYYGRSEQAGFFSQQFIPAEGGFKAQLEPAFANQWILTSNFSTTIWNWIFAYGDVGLVKNRKMPAEFLYDSGIRLNLVEDYFEVYFPIYSSNGWEVGQGDYQERFRFIITLDIQTLWRLFTRRWY